MAQAQWTDDFERSSSGSYTEGDDFEQRCREVIDDEQAEAMFIDLLQRRETLLVALNHHSAIAALVIQRWVRGFLLRLRRRRRAAAIIIAAAVRGFRARMALSKASEIVAATKRRMALQGERTTSKSTNGSNGGAQSDSLGATKSLPASSHASATHHSNRGMLASALMLQRWFRRSIPVRRARIRASRVKRVVAAAVDIQRVWKGYRQRQRTKDYLRIRRWARQVKELRAVLNNTTVTAEGQHMTSVMLDVESLESTSAWVAEKEEDAIVDPVADAKYFRSLRAMPKWERPTNRGHVTPVESRRFTTSMTLLNRDCDAAEAAYEAELRRDAERRVRDALRSSHSRVRARLPIATKLGATRSLSAAASRNRGHLSM